MTQEGNDKLVVALNGGPRKRWNTALLLEEVLKGAEEEGAAVELAHLHDLRYGGCASCFHCKRKESYLDGRCALKDGLSPVLELLGKATGVALGSPVYIGDVTGAARNFIERWMFVNLAYDRENPFVLSRGPGLGLIYTMGMPEDGAAAAGYDALFASHLRFFSRLNAPFVERIFAYDTLQFDDYGKYHAPAFDPEHKKNRREKNFPENLAAARELGRKLGRLTELPKLLKDA
ncbi:MAG: flavodoxin family protein [Deltaproteobacteria bacterium]|jgi:multimeric flavodoxin WrbA|nr:flavodoxin family protein [Deltaproteobacteria bacterium]